VSSVLLAVATVRLRTVHRVALAASGFDVHDIERPEEIANRLARSAIDLLVIDVTTRFGGSALLHQLARDADLPDRVLALTPVNEPSVVSAALDAGADDYLPVTASAARVVATARRLMGEAQQLADPAPAGGTIGRAER
jgi:DNA-binding NarL/FixJ family response regulator